MAATCSACSSTRSTSWPARASAAPVMPPIAPAPKTVMVMVPSDLTHAREPGQGASADGGASTASLWYGREHMDAVSGLMLLGAGFVGGIVTGVVGGASLIAFPAMLAAGLPPIIANASSAVAMTPGNFIAGIADLERRPPGTARSRG